MIKKKIPRASGIKLSKTFKNIGQNENNNNTKDIIMHVKLLKEDTKKFI